jgi:hypothetical protein
MDAATAAAMSDPDLDRWFRRRWHGDPKQAAPPLAPHSRQPDSLELTGRQPLERWHGERAQRDTQAAR